MDESLRRTASSLTLRLRAGRVDPELVAYAGFLGHPQALGTGLRPWEPPDPREPPYPAYDLLDQAPLTARESLWLATCCLELAAARLAPQAPVQSVLNVTYARCLGQATRQQAEDAFADLRGQGPRTVLHFDWAARAFQLERQPPQEPWQPQTRAERLVASLLWHLDVRACEPRKRAVFLDFLFQPNLLDSSLREAQAQRLAKELLSDTFADLRRVTGSG